MKLALVVLARRVAVARQLLANASVVLAYGFSLRQANAAAANT